MSITLRRKTRFRLKVAAISAVVVIFAITAYHYIPRPQKAAASTPSARNAVRRSDLKMIASALKAYMTQKGTLPVNPSTTPTAICVTDGTACKASHLTDLSFLYTTGNYLTALPTDPTGIQTRYSTGYTIAHNASGKIVLAAPQAEAGAKISVTQ